MVYRQLVSLEGNNWRSTCEQLTPRRIYQAMEKMEKELHNKSKELREKCEGHDSKPMKWVWDRISGSAATDASPTGEQAQLQLVDELRQFAENVMRIIQPVHSAERSRQPAVAAATNVDLCGDTARPLSPEQRQKVLAGKIRCSALGAPYRATPRTPVRPLCSNEVRPLVVLAEYFATKLPPFVLEWLHPRVFASRPMLVICAAIAALVAAYPAGAHVALLILWWLAMLAAAAMFALVYCRWRRLNPPAQPAAPESWVPWIAEQLSRGVPQSVVREELMVRLQPLNDEASVDSMLQAAAEQMRWQY